jgi:hypothetical protein
MSGLSYSNFSTLRQCGQKYKLSVIDKIPQPLQVHFEFGSALHAGLNTALETKDADAAMDVFAAYWETVVDKGLKYDRHTHAMLGDMGVKFVANFTRKYASKMELIVAEKRMYHTYKHGRFGGTDYIDLEGTPDALVTWDGQNVLLDFKSSAYNYDPEKTDISLQLLLYAWLLEQNGFKVDAIAFVVFNKGTGCIQTPRIIPYDKEKALTMISDMVSYFIRNKDHHERNPNSCIMGKQVCPYFSKCFGGSNE